MCAELHAFLFMHPQDSAVATGVEKRLHGKGYLDNTIGNPARNDDRAIASEFRGHVRPRHETVAVCGKWRRLSGVLRGSLGRSVRDFPVPLQGCHAEEKAD